MLQECLLRTPKAAGAPAPVGEDDVWVHGSHIQVVDQGALFSVGHVPQRLQLCLDLIPYLFVVDNILHRCLTLHCDCILQILIQLVYQGLSAASTNSFTGPLVISAPGINSWQAIPLSADERVCSGKADVQGNLEHCPSML